MFTKPPISHLQVFTISHHQFCRIINIYGKVCSRKSKFGHLSSFSASKNSFITPSYCRKCQQNQVFFKSDSKHPYCKNACETTTMCGEVRVPEDHLEVCRVCNAFGQNCGVVGSNSPGEGINNADFVFYISAMETERCQKGMTVAYAAHCQQEAALDRYSRITLVKATL